jgi:hypothetical protein
VDIFSTQPVDAAVYKAPAKKLIPRKDGESPADYLKRKKAEQ